MNRPGFHTITLGCKLNQFDSAAIEGELARRGYASQPGVEGAALVVINTCTVTHRADADARKLIRRVRRANPDCRLLVTGCYAELEPDEVREVGGIDAVFGNRDKARLGAILDELGLDGPGPPTDTEIAGADRGCDASLDLPRALHFGDRARAFLKVQEGCRLACSYCIIPTVRGASRSVPPQVVEHAALALFERGYREIVLTGINTGDYGRDLDPPIDLATLLRRLTLVAGPNRIRLNSLEPRTVTDDIVALMAAEPRLAPHLQIPLQSGSAPILRGMRRNYGLETYRARVDALRAALPHVGLGADVIVGFPGESDERFRETLDFIAASPLNYLHVFSWSPRPGTPASELPGRVRDSVIRDRSASLRRLSEELTDRFRRGFLGHELDCVVLGDRADGQGVRALSGNFIELTLPPNAARRGDVVRARPERIDTSGVHATPVGAPEWSASRARPSPAGEAGRRSRVGGFSARDGAGPVRWW